MYRTDKKDRRVGRQKFFFWGTMLLVTVILQYLARSAPGFAEWYAKNIYPQVLLVLGGISSFVPFALDECLIYLLVLAAFYYLLAGFIRIRQKRTEANTFAVQTGKNIGKILILWLFAFTVTCGMNYHRTPFSELARLPMEPSTVAELEELCLWLTEQIEEVSVRTQRQENGLTAVPSGMREKTRAAMMDLGKQYHELAGWYPEAKPVWTWKVLSMEFLEGVFGPYTMEAHYNPDIPAYNQPAVLCHELSHLKGFMREDEANYIAYLACTGSEDPTLQYSGLLLAYTHSINALYKADYERFVAVREKLCEQAERDYAYHRLYWEQYEGPVSRVSDKVNDTYLRANAQEEGSKSYGRMVDLLLGEYRQRRAGESPAARLVRGS